MSHSSIASDVWEAECSLVRVKVSWQDQFREDEKCRCGKIHNTGFPDDVETAIIWWLESGKLLTSRLVAQVSQTSGHPSVLLVLEAKWTPPANKMDDHPMTTSIKLMGSSELGFQRRMMPQNQEDFQQVGCVHRPDLRVHLVAR